jgi:PhnB protein
MAAKKPRKSSQKAAGPKRRTSPAQGAIPPGFHTLTPYLSVEGGVAALEFYQKAFGAKELVRQLTPDGKVLHGRLMIGNSILMLSDVYPMASTSSPKTAETTTVTIHMYCRDARATWDRAVAAGAVVLMPMADMFWGERYGQLQDPFGHHWSISQQIPMSKAEMDAKRREAMAQFAKAEH